MLTITATGTDATGTVAVSVTDPEGGADVTSCFVDPQPI